MSQNCFAGGGHTPSAHTYCAVPGFSHGDVANIFDATDGKVAVSVARNDGPSNMISQLARKSAAIIGKGGSK